MDKKISTKQYYALIAVVLYIIGAFAFWEFVYELCNMIGSISCGDPGRALTELIRMLPLIVTSWIYVYLGVFCHRAYIAPSKQDRAQIWRANGCVTVVLGIVVIACVITGVAIGTYEKLVEGYITPLYPLDMMIGGALFVVYGILSVRYADYQESRPAELPCHRNIHCAPLRILGRIFTVLGYAVSLASFAACIYGTYVLDFTHGYVLYNIMLWLNYATAVAMVIVYRFVYCEVEESKRPDTMRKYALMFLILNILLLILYLVTVQVWNEAPNQNAFGILPIEFTASFNAFLPIYVLMNIVGPLAALVRSHVLRRALTAKNK